MTTDPFRPILGTTRETGYGSIKQIADVALRLMAERDAAVAQAAERERIGEQMADDKRRNENQLRSELQQAQAASATLRQEKVELQKQVDAARQRVAALEQAAAKLRQQVATGQTAQTRELAQLNATLTEQRATFESEQKQWMDKLQNLRQELEACQQRAAAPAATPPTDQPSAPAKPAEPGVSPAADKPVRSAPSADLYCLPRRKVRDDS